MKSDPEMRKEDEEEEKRCSSVWDVKSQLPSRLCVCSLGRHRGKRKEGRGGGGGGEAWQWLLLTESLSIDLLTEQ